MGKTRRDYERGAFSQATLRKRARQRHDLALIEGVVVRARRWSLRRRLGWSSSGGGRDRFLSYLFSRSDTPNEFWRLWPVHRHNSSRTVPADGKVAASLVENGAVTKTKSPSEDGLMALAAQMHCWRTWQPFSAAGRSDLTFAGAGSVDQPPRADSPAHPPRCRA